VRSSRAPDAVSVPANEYVPSSSIEAK